MQEITLLWWHWLAAGMVLLLLDLFMVSSFYLLFIGLGMLPVTVLVLAFPAITTPVQGVVWALSSCLFITLWRLFRRSEETTDGVAGMRGSKCIVVSWEGDSGRVRLQRPFQGRDQWDAKGPESIAVGDSCRITAVDSKASCVTLAKN